jgi:nucleotide-binding universal stress UspA family protein
MFKTVLVPLDGSLLAEQALKPAVHLAQQSSGTIYLLRVPVYSDRATHVSPDFNQALPQYDLVPEYDDASEYLREIRDRISAPNISIRTLIVEGDRAHAIVDTARAKNVDLIAMSTHARKGVSRWLMGSVGGKVLRESYAPVLLIRKPVNFANILITLDGSKLAEEVIEAALVLAQSFKSRVTLLQVTDEVKEGDVLPPDESNYLDDVKSRFASSGLEIEGVQLSGPVADNILSFALENDIDLIAMSTRGRSGLRKIVFGSMTEKVMCDCGCAMLIARPADTIT